MAVVSAYTTSSRGLWKIDESADELQQLLVAASSCQSLPDTLRTEKRCREWLATRLLLLSLLGKDAPVAYHPNGAPFLPGESLHISLSHTDGYAAAVVQPAPFAGVDIERKTDRVWRVRHKFVSEKEEEAMDAVHEREHLLLHWCAKEALFKMIGQEEVDFRRHLHVLPFVYAEAGNLLVQESRTPYKRTFELGFQVTADFAWVWSTGNRLLPG